MLEVADIFREAGVAYRRTFGSRMLPSHRKAMRDIEACRTKALGGHLRLCDCCHKEQYSYHSCRNRHCPKCHTDQTRRWLAKQQSRLLPCSYFLLTFTFPQQLRPLARSHQKLLYGILMTCAAEALLKLAADPQYLGARPGIMAVLHTWTRAMFYHPHAHLLVTGGGLTPDRKRWITPKHPRFLVPAYALSEIFRAKVKDALRHAGLLDQIPSAVWRRRWVVHAQHAGSGQKVLEYLSRYLFRIAIVNSRIEKFQDQQVTFRYRDNHSGSLKRCTLTAQEFIARFLQHVLPRGLVKIRYCGLCSPARIRDLEAARALLADQDNPAPTAAVLLRDPDPPPDAHQALDNPQAPAGNPLAGESLCPFCRVGTMRVVKLLAPQGRSP